MIIIITTIIAIHNKRPITITITTINTITTIINITIMIVIITTITTIINITIMTIPSLALLPSQQVRDGGPHFQNYKICYFESTVFAKYGKEYSVSAFAKRHGWNECDGALARLVVTCRDSARPSEGSPPTDAWMVAALINDPTNAKYYNSYAHSHRHTHT
jgi:hypothetical protein